ncbi:hypothetical protein D3C85_677430 [compost metagenome]
MGNVTQVVVDAHAIGRRKVRQKVLAQLHVNVATLGDLDGVLQRLGNVAEQVRHFLGGLEVLLVGIGARTAWVTEDPALADTDAGLVGLEVTLLDEAHIVGGHQRRAATVGQGDRGMHVLFVVGARGALQLQVEALGEHGLPLGQQRLGGGLVAIQQSHADLAFLGAGQGDQAFGGLLHPVALDDHQVVALAFGPASGDQFGEVAVALGVHRQQGHAAQRAILITAGQPDVGAADGLDAGAHGGLVELHQRAHVALVGDRHCRHARPGHGLYQRLDPHQAVYQGIFGVQTQMDEGSGHGSPMQNAKTTRPGLYRALVQSYRLKAAPKGRRSDCTCSRISTGSRLSSGLRAAPAPARRSAGG